MQVRIPQNDIEAHQVAEIHQLSGWGLAGYVASQVKIGESGGTGANQHGAAVRTDRCSPAEFAARGIRGLRSKNTVQLYAERWAMTGLPVPKPGQVVEIDLDWPPTSLPTAPSERDQAIIDQAEEDHVGASKAIDIVNNRKAMMSAIKADPETARAAGQALDERAKRAMDDEGVVDLGPEFRQSDLDSESIRLSNRAQTLYLLIQDLRQRCSPEEWERLRPRVTRYIDLAYLYCQDIEVPDTIEELS